MNRFFIGLGVGILAEWAALNLKLYIQQRLNDTIFANAEKQSEKDL